VSREGSADVALPLLPQPDPGLVLRLLELRVTPEFVRATSVPPDTLFSPLRLTREASLRDDPPYVLLRETFCLSDFHVRWVRGLLLYSDYLREDEPLCVMGGGETTAVLYNFAQPLFRVSSILDVGCGAGTLALLLAGLADRVVATDINPRAVEFTRFNAALNLAANVEARTGDLFQPVKGERFDLIVSQPPYYPGLEGPVFLQGGAQGTEVAARLFDGVAEHLAPGGQAVVHTSLPKGAPVPEIPGLETLEYTPEIGEVEGTRHSVLFFTHGSGTRQMVVPHARWGSWPI
jgi:SAM-dependent methyltransferase